MDVQLGIIQITVRNLSTGKTVYDVACSDGVSRQVWEAPIATALNAFAGTGAQVWLRTSEKQNGQYTNRSIHAFAPPGQALPPDTGGPGGGFGGGGGRPGGGGGGRGGMSEADKTRISKMGAQGSAATLVAALFSGAGPEAFEEAVEKHAELTKRLYKSARSHEAPEAAGPTVLQTGTQGQVLPSVGQPVATGAVLPTTPAEVAAQVPGVVVGVPVAQDAAAEAPQPAPVDDIDWT